MTNGFIGLTHGHQYRRFNGKLRLNKFLFNWQRLFFGELMLLPDKIEKPARNSLDGNNWKL
jgi:hypothetical protein